MSANAGPPCAHGGHRAALARTSLVLASMMTLVMLESAAIAVSFLAAFEMWRQRMPWRLILITFLIMVTILNALIHGWRGL